ncbi:glycosyltransferase family 4 protein [Cyclobacterium jeungdonense]|uniref:Glycosyltransferase family 4 protein n=1 Tax=Cyclobacterium jeungdonense TaxID=708087 RepID=A0ABT8CES6_9BACT|nr:glycosyltransferase family 4 protein [Cyclobacterium jeungdonense]MDN3690225.1 glycosyltransferase family 4 protein [Cyclobacterium jeungdonense]
MRETNKYDLNIIGFSSKKTPKIKNIRFIEIFSKSRYHPARFLVPITFLFHLFSINPRLVILTTFELLPVAVLGKWFLGYKLVYDVQENYRKNIRHNATLPATIRPIASVLVRLIESSGRPFIDAHLLAEQCYQKEMPGLRNATVIENKAELPQKFLPAFRLTNPSSPRFLLTGTIAEAYGVSEAIIWFLELLKTVPLAQLHILGHCPMKSLAKELQKQVDIDPRINLQISSIPLPKHQIEDALRTADVLLLPYRPLPSIVDKIPTKLYEGIALQKPILISKNPLWGSILNRYPAGLEINFNELQDLANIWQRFSSLQFYQRPPGTEIDWQIEKIQLLTMLDKL